MPQRTAKAAPIHMESHHRIGDLAQPRAPTHAQDRADGFGLRLPPAFINGKKDRHLVCVMTIEGLRCIAGAAGDAVSIRAVKTPRIELNLRRAGYAPQTFYRHYADKM